VSFTKYPITVKVAAIKVTLPSGWSIENILSTKEAEFGILTIDMIANVN